MGTCRIWVLLLPKLRRNLREPSCERIPYRPLLGPPFLIWGRILTQKGSETCPWSRGARFEMGVCGIQGYNWVVLSRLIFLVVPRRTIGHGILKNGALASRDLHIVRPYPVSSTHRRIPECDTDPKDCRL